MRLQKQDIPFTMVANEVLCRTDISLKAKGIFAYLFSKPHDWVFAADRIARECKESRKAIQAALRELEQVGLLRREKLPDGHVVYNIEYAESQSPKSGLRLFDPKSQNGTVPKRLRVKSGLITNTEVFTKKEEYTKTEATTEFFEQARRKSPAYADLVQQLAIKDYLKPRDIHAIVMDEFIPYWTEASPGEKKQLWEMKKVFDPRRRLMTWLQIHHQKKRDWRCEKPMWHRQGERCYCFPAVSSLDPPLKSLPPEMFRKKSELAGKFKM